MAEGEFTKEALAKMSPAERLRAKRQMRLQQVQKERAARQAPKAASPKPTPVPWTRTVVHECERRGAGIWGKARSPGQNISRGTPLIQ